VVVEAPSTKEFRMKLHANAALSLKGRERMVMSVLEQGRAIAQAAQAAGVSARTCSKWVVRYRAEGPAGLLDRSSAPKTVANRTDRRTEELLGALRRLRFTSPELSELLGMPLSTVSAVLKRLGMGRLGRLGLEPAIRYERARPGELVHVDVKKLGRIQGGAGKRMTGGITRNRSPRRRDAAGVDRCVIGWDAVHVAVDDATRLAYAEVLPDEKAHTSVAFLERAIAFFAQHGITVERVITDNGAPYLSAAHAAACRALGIRHLRTRPYRPQTNGKAERFIRTLLSGWAYGAIYASSPQRTAALDGWLWRYNHRRPHQAIGRQTPITRLNNLLGTYS
jgi:transposase InsO family protein